MTHKKTALIMILFAIILSGCSAIPEMLSPWLDWPPSEGTEPPTPTATTVVETAVPTHTLPAETPIVEPLPTDAVSPPDGDFTYTLQAGNPFYLPNFNHPDADCNWMGIAGQVFGPDGESLLGVTIEVGDLGAGDSAVFSGITGEVQAYGLGGYEIKLADAPLATSGVYWVQAFDAEGVPLSARIFFDTFADCERNLVLLNLVYTLVESPMGGEPTPVSTLEPYP